MPRRPRARRWRFNPRPPSGGRRCLKASPKWRTGFNPRPPHGGRHIYDMSEVGTQMFQPTPSARRATVGADALYRHEGAVSTHALRAEGDSAAFRVSDHRLVSTHALRAEGDCVRSATRSSSVRFQPTPSVRRATRRSSPMRGTWRDFNPRPPCGGRPECEECEIRRIKVSTHALRAEGDGCSRAARPQNPCFNPRPPCGGRPSRSWSRRLPGSFNPRPPCGGRQVATVLLRQGERFQPTPSVRRATVISCTYRLR